MSYSLVSAPHTKVSDRMAGLATVTGQVCCLYHYLTFLLPAEKIKQATQLLRAAHAGSLALCSQCYGALPRFPAQQPDCHLDAKCACDG